MAQVTYSVVKGDTLTSIAKKHNTTVDALVKLNDIQNANVIYVGQVLVISGEADPAKTETNTTTNKAVVSHFGLIASTERTMYASWKWDKANTDHYQVRWYYSWGVGVAPFEESTITDNYSSFTPPEYATHVTFMVRPISKTYKVKDVDTNYWTAEWSTGKTYWFKDNPPVTPPVPEVEIRDYTLTASVKNIDGEELHADKIQFEIYRIGNDNSSKFLAAEIIANSATISTAVEAGSEYKVRCRSVKVVDSSNKYSEWSAWSSSSNTPPAAPGSITECRAVTDTSVYLAWHSVSNADSYEIEYATKKTYLGGSNASTTVQTEGAVTYYELTGLGSGEEYFFRVRAVNACGKSGWTGIKSIVLGKAPAAPTTWSSTTTAIIGESLTLYWIHNSEDGSTQTSAEVEMTVNGETTMRSVDSTNEEDDEKTTHLTIYTSGYSEGAEIIWRVRTAGATKIYGDWSIWRTVNIYAPPTLVLNVTDVNGDMSDTLTSFPLYISGIAGPNTQTPIGYHVSITANSSYDTVDNVGNQKFVLQDEAVYSKYFNTTEQLVLALSAGHVDLENNIAYTVNCRASMDSGLTAEASTTFTVAWTDEEFHPNAEIGIEREAVSAYIRPYCTDENGELIEGVTLSVYRREFDGSFTQIATSLDNMTNIFVTDPHPSLDFARYRIVAITDSTGAVSYYDVPGYPVGEHSVVIQWDEVWSDFDVTDGGSTTERPWAGSLLKLPYNIDVSDNYRPDVSLVEYIGRRHPVGYYGTHVGMTSTWNVDIDKKDKDTLYALRRLSMWMGDVYVREPSGSGYWANITVSYSQKHCEVTIPVTLSVTRVDENGSGESVRRYSGTSDSNVYTKSETRSLINSAINNAIGDAIGGSY